MVDCGVSLSSAMMVKSQKRCSGTLYPITPRLFHTIMGSSSTLIIWTFLVSWLFLNVSASHETRFTYKPLPSLREQAQIQDGWLRERLARIPSLLVKYDVDAWLVSSTRWGLLPVANMEHR